MYSSYVHSPTFNEPGHLVAGISHWKFGRFELYRVNPPLVRMIAALPAMAVGYEEDWSGFFSGLGTRPVFGMGRDFIAVNGERSFFLLMISRWACIPFCWLGAIVCYLWARDLYGRRSGLLACLIWCLSPDILAHGSLITADCHATALGLAACYTFWRWLKRPTWRQAVLTGGVLGLAELAKTTMILFYPLWPLMWIIYRWPERKSLRYRDWIREAGMLALRMAIGLYVLNLGYGFDSSFKPLHEFSFVSRLFRGPVENTDLGPVDDEGLPVNTRNRFANSWLGDLPVPFPQQYIQGIDIQQLDFEKGRRSYLNGQWHDRGWWYYYLYAALLKIPLGTLGVIAGALVITLRFRHRSAWRDELTLLLPALFIFLVVSSKTGFSENFRYVLPGIPFLFVWSSKVADYWRVSQPGPFISGEQPRNGQARTLVLSTLISWSIVSTVFVYPHSLSYFNESIGGPANGSKYLLCSNIDWGQDLRYLEWHLARQSERTDGSILRLAYHGYFSPVDLGFGDSLPWDRNQTDELDRNVIPAGTREYFAVSLNLLHGFGYAAQDGPVRSTRLPIDVQETFKSRVPSARVAYSILLYEIPGTQP